MLIRLSLCMFMFLAVAALGLGVSDRSAAQEVSLPESYTSFPAVLSVPAATPSITGPSQPAPRSRDQLSRDPARLAALKAAADAGALSVHQSGTTTTVVNAVAAQPSPLIVSGTTFDGLRNSTAVPPDTQLAVGPTYIIEMVNNSARVFSRAGATISTVTLRSLFGVPAGHDGDGDPKVIYDAQSGRFFAAYLSYQVNALPGTHTSLYVAVSTNSDPTSWLVCRYDDVGYLHDQPEIGTSDDKIAIGTNAHTYPQEAWVGAELRVFDKNALVNSNLCISAYFAPVAADNTIRPAQALSAGPTLYAAASDDLGGSILAIWTVTGNPSTANVVRSKTALTMTGAVAVPPNAQQPATMSRLRTNDARADDVFWRSGSIFVASNSGCFPAGDTTPRSCLKLVQASTAGSPSITRETFLAAFGTDLFYPAWRPDSNGNLIIVYTTSSPSVYAGVQVAALNPIWTSITASTIRSGLATYTDVFGAPYRWGDYSGAAVDPTNPNVVWVAGEYAATSSPQGWGTFIGQMAFSSLATPTATVTTTPTSTPTNTSTPTATRAASVGGIAEAVDPATLPSSTAAVSGNDRTVYGLAGVAGVLAGVAGAGAVWRRRKVR